MTRAELAEYDGRDGRLAYIAVNGTVYDVTESPRWENGLHPPDHQAGQDLTEELAQAPHVRTVIERFPVVGSLEDTPSTPPVAAGGGKVTLGIIVAAIIFAVIIFLVI